MRELLFLKTVMMNRYYCCSVKRTLLRLFQTILGDFAKEQEKFVTEKKEKKRTAEAGVAPWVGYNEEESMKSQILALSQVSFTV